MKTELNKKYPAIDVGKFLCALLVLFYHYFTEHDPVPALLEEALSLYAVAVALFMTISGFLTFNKLKNLENKPDRWAYIYKQVLRILKIYLLWSIPYLIFTICRWDFSAITPSFVLWKIQGWIFHTTFSTIWFLPSLAIGLLISYYVTEKFSSQAVVVLSVLMYCLGALAGTYKFAGQSIPGFDLFYEFTETWLGGSRGGIFYAFPLIMVGRLVAYKRPTFKCLSWFILSFISTAILLAEALTLRYFAGNTGIDNTIMMIPVVFCILGFLITFKIPDGAYTVFLRKMSVLIFVTQRLFLTVLPGLLSEGAKNMIFSNIWIGAIIICGGTVLFSALIIILSKRFKCLKHLY